MPLWQFLRVQLKHIQHLLDPPTSFDDDMKILNGSEVVVVIWTVSFHYGFSSFWIWINDKENCPSRKSSLKSAQNRTCNSFFFFPIVRFIWVKLEQNVGLNLILSIRNLFDCCDCSVKKEKKRKEKKSNIEFMSAS